jgi:signal transduction histidine kinase
MVYHADGSQAFGLFLHDEFDDVPFSDAKEPQKLEIDGKTYLYYDQKLSNGEEEGMWIRGVTYDRFSSLELLKKGWYVLIVLPLLIALAFAGGYWLTGRFLKPVQDISRTAEDIRISGDLTKRIPVSDAGDELTELSRSFNAMFDRLEDNFEAERRFTSNASHELRTPVAVIMAQCEYALEGEDKPEELRDALAAVQRQGYRMSHLIETLLVFTRIEQSTEKYPMSETELSELTRSVCEDFQLIADRGIAVPFLSRRGSLPG